METSGAAGKLTHINYAFGFIGPEGTCYSADPWADWQRPVPADQSVDGVADSDDQPLKGNLGQLKKLKARHPGLKVLISLGGWTGSAHFSDAVLTPNPAPSSPPPASTCGSRATSPAFLPAPPPASSTASTSTGNGQAPPETTATSSAPKTSRTSPCSWPNYAAR